MARKDILPSYLAQQPWRDLCDAIDVIWKSYIDDPINNLGKIRRARPLSFEAKGKIEAGELFLQEDLEYFEDEVLVRQINMLGLLVTNHPFYTTEQLLRLMRNVAQFWYGKGTGNVADFLSFVLGTPVTFTRMWTQNYVDFYKEGDPTIGTPIYQGGTWYPTTHTTVTLLDPPGGIPLELFAKLVEGLANYPLVFIFEVVVIPIYLSTLSGPFLVLDIVGTDQGYEMQGTYTLTGAEDSVSNGVGGFESITPVALPGPGGTGYVPPAVPVADFTQDLTSGAHPLTVTFSLVASPGVISEVAWDFDSDGFIDSTSRNPTWTFAAAGVYSVTQYVMNSAGSDRITKHNLITVT